VHWRLDLGSDWPYVVKVVGDNPPQLAVWLSDRDIDFFALPTGAYYGRLTAATDSRPGSDGWRVYLEQLVAPNGAYLPVAWAGQTGVYTSHDGRLRLVHAPGRDMVLDADGQQTTLSGDGMAAVSAVGFDRELGTVAAVSDDGRLHMYQQGVYVGTYTVEIDPQAVIALAVPDGGDFALVIEESRVQAVTMGGVIRDRLPDLPRISAAACSPDGEILVSADGESGMLRAYDAALRLRAQEPALDVLARAPSLQLPEDAPWPQRAPHALDVDNSGRLALAVEGVLCVTHVRDLAPVAQPRALL
jgi:hypothetical protein